VKIVLGSPLNFEEGAIGVIRAFSSLCADIASPDGIFYCPN
jgi:hypothetical protein